MDRAAITITVALVGMASFGSVGLAFDLALDAAGDSGESIVDLVLPRSTTPTSGRVTTQAQAMLSAAKRVRATAALNSLIAHTAGGAEQANALRALHGPAGTKRAMALLDDAADSGSTDALVSIAAHIDLFSPEVRARLGEVRAKLFPGILAHGSPGPTADSSRMTGSRVRWSTQANPDSRRAYAFTGGDVETFLGKHAVHMTRYRDDTLLEPAMLIEVRRGGSLRVQQWIPGGALSPEQQRAYGRVFPRITTQDQLAQEMLRSVVRAAQPVNRFRGEGRSLFMSGPKARNGRAVRPWNLRGGRVPHSITSSIALGPRFENRIRNSVVHTLHGTRPRVDTSQVTTSPFTTEPRTF